MKNIFTALILVYLSFSLNSCCQKQFLKNDNLSANSIQLIGEYIIPVNTMYRNTVVGGLSSIDYSNGKYYLISDDKKKPVRFYEMKIDVSINGIDDFEITDMVSIHNDEKYIDPEGLRFDKLTNHFFWTSEGAVRKGISPSVYEITSNGESVRKFETPSIFEVSEKENFGPRQNGTFECLSMSANPDYFWIGMELPLKQDGEEPSLKDGEYPVRISKINKNTGTIYFQFVYKLNKIPKDSKPKGKFLVNGLPEILEIDKSHFIFVERAYASGHNDGGNTVKLFKVDISKASDVKELSSLKGQKYIAANKTLLFDFETIRPKLTNGIVDNIEGITFGPTLKNGHKTIIVVSDNNFSKFSPQLNQIIVLELLP